MQNKPNVSAACGLSIGVGESRLGGVKLNRMRQARSTSNQIMHVLNIPKSFLLTISGLVLVAAGVSAGEPTTYNISEIFSTPDGSFQFIELEESSNDNSRSDFKDLELRSGKNTYVFPANLPSLFTARDSVLIATQGVADLLSEQKNPISPDFILPDQFFDPTGDTITFPASGVERTIGQGELPLNGFESLAAITSAGSAPLMPAPASPTAFDSRNGSTGIPRRLVAPSSARGDAIPGVAYFDDTSDTVMFEGDTELGTAATLEAVVSLTADVTGHVFFEQVSGKDHKQLMVGSRNVSGFAFSPQVNVSGFEHTDTEVTLNTFHHVAFVRDGREERLYLDGRLLERRSAEGDIGDAVQTAAVPFSPAPFPGAIGASQFHGTTTRTNAMIGFVDSVRVSDVARYSGDRFDPPAGDMENDQNTQLLYNFNLDEIGESTVLDLAEVNARPGYLGPSRYAINKHNWKGTAPEIIPLSEIGKMRRIEGLFPTGVDDDYRVLAAGEKDPHFTVDGESAFVQTPNPEWIKSVQAG